MRAVMRLTIAATTAMLLVLGSSVAANAEPTPAPDYDPTAVTGEIDYRVGDLGQLPAVDSEVGVGATLSSEPGSLVSLAETAGYASALLRVSVFSPAQHTTVFRAGGVASLQTQAGASASTTMLVPIDGEGRAQLWADTPVQARVEVLASFNGTQTQPGSTLALAEPALRADTRSGLAGTSLGSTPIHVGLTGQGGVPSERVRAAYVTATVDAEGAGTLDIGTQRVPVAAGTTTFTTVLSPDADGGVPVSLTGSTGHLALHVVGWMPDAPDQATKQSLPGSFVPTSNLDETYSQKVTEQRDDFQTLTRNSDASYSIGLVTLAPTAATERTFFEFGPAYEGRARGAVVDPAQGAAPQLVLVPATAEGDGFTLRRGEAQLSWLPVGDLLGQAHSAPTKDFEISIDTHRPGQRVDLSQEGYFTLGGTVSSEGVVPSLDRIEVSVDGEGLIGYADVWEENGVLRWEADLSAPESGVHGYSVQAFDRGGNTRQSEIELDIERFDDDDTVIAPDIWVLNEEEGVTEARVVEGEADTVYVTAQVPLKPGDSLISRATEATPSGVFAEVESFDRVGDEWRVRTISAKIEDVFLQVDIDEQQNYENLEQSTLDESAFEAGLDIDGAPAELEAERLPGDAGYETAEVVTGDAVDLDPFEYECDPTALDTGADPCPPQPVIDTVGAPDTAGAAETVDTAGAPQQSGVASAVLRHQPAGGGIRPAADIEVSRAFGFKINTKLVKKEKGWSLTDVASSSANPEAEVTNDVQRWAKEGKGEFGVGLSLAAQAVPALNFTLETEITWKWRVIPTGITVTKFSIELKNTMKAQVALSLYLKFEGAMNLSQKIVSIDLPTATIMAGPVPIVLQNKIDLVMKATLELKATATVKFGVSRTDVVGTQYTPEKGWESLSKPTKSSSLPLNLKPIGDVNAEFEGELAVGPSIEPQTALYGVAGPKLDITIRAGIAGAIEYSFVQQKWVLSAEVFAELGYTVRVKFKLFSLEWDRTLAEQKFRFTFWKKEWTYGDDDEENAAAALSPPGRYAFDPPPPIPT